jgi:hypothetical protein
MAKLSRDETLLVSQRNQVFQLILKLGLDPTVFMWDEGHHSNADFEWRNSILRRRSTSYYCEFRAWLSDWDMNCSPFGAQRHGMLKAETWQHALKRVEEWLGWIKLEEEPDLWASVAAGGESMFREPGAIDNRPFDASEQEKIAAAVALLKEHIAQAYPDDQHRKRVDNQLAHLVEASTRIGRKDWTTLAIGALAQIVIMLAMDADAAGKLFETASQLLNWLWPSPPLLF